MTKMFDDKLYDFPSVTASPVAVVLAALSWQQVECELIDSRSCLPLVPCGLSLSLDDYTTASSCPPQPYVEPTVETLWHLAFSRVSNSF